MNTSFLIVLSSGKTQRVKASRFEMVREDYTKRLVYNFYGESESKSQCFFACEDIVGIIPSDMNSRTHLN